MDLDEETMIFRNLVLKVEAGGESLTPKSDQEKGYVRYPFSLGLADDDSGQTCQDENQVHPDSSSSD